jgi:hypothetical protein
MEIAHTTAIMNNSFLSWCLERYIPAHARGRQDGDSKITCIQKNLLSVAVAKTSLKGKLGTFFLFRQSPMSNTFEKVPY